jgi:D-alanyl-D-alanine carboxypeptidase
MRVTVGMRGRCFVAALTCLVTVGCTGAASTRSALSRTTPAARHSGGVSAPTTRAPGVRLTTPLPTATRTAVARPAVARPTGPPGLVWAANRVPEPVLLAAGRLGSAAAVVAVANGTAWLPAPAVAGHPMATPIDVSAADPALYARAMPTAPSSLAGLRPGQVVLAADSARLRGLRVGDRTSLIGVSLRVAAIVADGVVGDAEMFVTPADGQRLHLPANRYLLIRPLRPSGWPTLAAALRSAVPVGTAVRIAAPGTARVLREADAVLPPLLEKLRFGEFTADPQVTSAGDLAIAPAWLAAHLTTADVPILGAVTCNRAFLPQLRAALAAVVRQGLQGLIHPSDYGGCYNARLIAGQPGQPISHHAYGSALDINVSANPDGKPPTQDPRLVRVFAQFGITWGGAWLVPDGMHFESLGRP